MGFRGIAHRIVSSTAGTASNPALWSRFVRPPRAPADERVQLDLGCGNLLHPEPGFRCIGVDRTREGTRATLITELGFEPIPMADASVDLVTAYDLLEHVPFTVFVTDTSNPAGPPKRLTPTVQLFNEVYRVLKPGSVFYSRTPVYPTVEAFQDPTHLSFWTRETSKYFSGNYFGFHTIYGHTSRFQRVAQRVRGYHLHLWLEALPPGTPIPA